MSTLEVMQPLEQQTVHRALIHLVRVGDAFIRGAGCQVEVDLDYCRDLAALERAVEAGKEVIRGER